MSASAQAWVGRILYDGTGPWVSRSANRPQNTLGVRVIRIQWFDGSDFIETLDKSELTMSPDLSGPSWPCRQIPIHRGASRRVLFSSARS